MEVWNSLGFSFEVRKILLRFLMFRSVFANNSVFNLHFMKVSTENNNNLGYEKIQMW